VWSSLIPVLLAATALLFIPGALLAAAAGLRVPLIVGLAPALSVAVIAGTGVVAPMLGISWGPVPIAAAVVLLAGAALAARLLAARRHPEDGGPWARPRLQPAAIAAWCISWPLSAVLTALTIGRILNTPDAISQTFDAVFHLNAVEWILRTGNASSLHFLLEAPSGSVYPVGWHTLVALVMRVCGASDVPAAVNATVFAAGGLVWTSGCLTLAHVLFRARPLALLTAAALAGGFVAFPFNLLSWGVLYSNYLAICLLPSLLAAARELVPSGAGGRRTGLLLPAGIIAAGGAGLAQPNAVVTLLIALVILSAGRLIATVRTPPDERPVNAVRRCGLTTGGMLLVFVITWFAMRPPRGAATWGPSYATSGAVGEAVTSTPVQFSVIWVPALLALLGFVVALRVAQYRWLAVLHLSTCALYVVARSTPTGDLRHFLTGIWYTDASRLAALLPLTGVPLAVLGAEAIARWGRERLTSIDRLRASSQQPWARWAAYPVIVLILALTGPLSGAMSACVKPMERAYLIAADSPSLTPDERALIDELPSLIGDDAVVAVDPASGAALAYALSGTDTTIKHLFHRDDTDLDIVQAKLNRAETDPAVCPALADLGADYALYFPGKSISDVRPYPGFASLNTAPGFELVANQGRAALYRITACG